jgi:L-threonylcarbamoyladenylate synthase
MDTITDAEIAAAGAVLRAGGLVAFPTETVYGLGADATNADAVRRVFAVKARPADHPLIVHLGSAADLPRWAALPPGATGELAERLAGAFWPGPLTLVLPRHPASLAVAAGGRDTVGLRVPDHPVALALLDAAGVPVAAPSANRFGRVSPTTAADVAAELGDGADLILDGGPAVVGVESTIVEIAGTDPLLLRPGGVPVEAIEAVAGRAVETVAVGLARAPGMLASHYAPAVRVELAEPGAAAAKVAAHAAAGCRVAVLAAAGGIEDIAGLSSLPGVVVLRSPGDDADYARQLYRRLRDAEELGVDVLVAVPPEQAGLGRAVADRLSRAAAPRPPDAAGGG